MVSVYQITQTEFIGCALVSNANPGDDGRVACWGQNSSGEVGDNTTDDRNRAVFAVDPFNMPISRMTQISGGGRHTCALKYDGSIWCWGMNQDGQLGLESQNNQFAPARVIGFGPGLNEIRAVRVFSGGRHTCALGEDSKAYCWGYNQYGQLGIEEGNTSIGAAIGEMNHANIEVKRPQGSIKQMSLGFSHTCALEWGGGVYCWGDRTSGALGDGVTSGNIGRNLGDVSGLAALNLNLEGGEVVKNLNLGHRYSCSHLEGSSNLGPRIKCWGRSNAGQLGNGDTTAQADASVAPSALINPIIYMSEDWFDTNEIGSDLSEADYWCRYFADMANLPSSNNFRGLLSSATVAANTRFNTTIPIHNTNGGVLAYSSDELWSSGPLMSMAVDEDGLDWTGEGYFVWTNSTSSGGIAYDTPSTNNCNDWTSTTGGQQAVVGNPADPVNWMNSGTSSCNNIDQNSIYCVGNF